MKPFHGANPAKILAAIYRDCAPEQVVSLLFWSDAPPFRTVAAGEQWSRLQVILGCTEVYNALGISSLPGQIPADFHYATGLETIGTLANLLQHGGVHQRFVDDYEHALWESRQFLDAALLDYYETAEAYSCHARWCDWFIGDEILDETVLLGNRGDWWLLAVTGTD